MSKKDTSWGVVADWYADHLEKDPDSYHLKVVLPNLLRLVDPQKGEKILDLACGTGFFSREFAAVGAQVTGIDISKELISIARKSSPLAITYHVSSADDLSVVPDKSIDKITLVLAIQNIEPVKKMLEECMRVLVPGGKMSMVMNHPAYRIPKGSSWGWDEEGGEQYRRIDKYLSESKELIAAHPGSEKSEETVSFHRPLQYYFKLFNNTGFAVSRLEEWISHKKSEPGARQKEEDRMRKEIPLFLYVEIKAI